jgi:hypothetical protein
MKAKPGLLFLFLILTVHARTPTPKTNPTRKRAGYQSFPTKQPKATRALKQKDNGISEQTPRAKPPAANRMLNTETKDYYDLIQTGRPNRPKPRSEYTSGDQCVLYAEMMPFYYNLLTRTSDFTVGFSSNCLAYVEVNFKIQYNRKKLINWFLHPSTVRLNLWGNQYRLSFKSSHLIDKFDINRAFEYRQVVLSNIMAGKRRLSLLQRNMTYLDPQSQHTFNSFTVGKLMKTNGRVDCKLRTLRPRGYKTMMLKRQRFIKGMRKRGEPDGKIRKMLKKKTFTPSRALQSKERRLVQNDRTLKKGKKRRNQKKTKKTRKRKSRKASSDMTPEERALYNRNRKKMMRRRKRSFVRGYEIICSVS